MVNLVPQCREIPAMGMSDMVPLVLLVQSFDTWLALSNLSRWLLGTIRLSYAIQFTRHPPKYNDILFTSV